MGKIIGVLFIIVGLVLIFIVAPQREIENLSPTFLEVWGPVGIIPPQHWSFVIRVVGAVIIFATVAAFVLSTIFGSDGEDENT